MENKKQQLKKLKNERGLTLVELLAVIVILGIISTIAFVMIGNVMDNAKKDAQLANAQQLIASAKLYEASGNDITGNVSAADLHSADFIDDLVDPWNKESQLEGSSVTKTDSGFTVTIKSASDKGNITDATEAQLRGDDSVEGDTGRAIITEQ